MLVYIYIISLWEIYVREEGRVDIYLSASQLRLGAGKAGPLRQTSSALSPSSRRTRSPGSSSSGPARHTYSHSEMS